MAALHVGLQRRLECHRRTDLAFDPFSRRLADEEVMLALHVLDDGGVHVATGNAQRTAVDDAG
jgi:hypothetical protein